jgi:hypothetical protein
MREAYRVGTQELQATRLPLRPRLG